MNFSFSFKGKVFCLQIGSSSLHTLGRTDHQRASQPKHPQASRLTHTTPQAHTLLTPADMPALRDTPCAHTQRAAGLTLRTAPHRPRRLAGPACDEAHTVEPAGTRAGTRSRGWRETGVHCSAQPGTTWVRSLDTQRTRKPLGTHISATKHQPGRTR